MDIFNKLLGHKRCNPIGGGTNHPRIKHSEPQISSELETEFVRHVVEELVDTVPQKSAAARRESTGANSVSSAECFSDLLQTESGDRKCQETEADVTEYESAADTDVSDRFPSSASLLTFSEQLLHDVQNESSPSPEVNFQFDHFLPNERDNFPIEHSFSETAKEENCVNFLINVALSSSSQETPEAPEELVHPTHIIRKVDNSDKESLDKLVRNKNNTALDSESGGNSSSLEAPFVSPDEKKNILGGTNSVAVNETVKCTEVLINCALPSLTLTTSEEFVHITDIFNNVAKFTEELPVVNQNTVSLNSVREDNNSSLEVVVHLQEKKENTPIQSTASVSINEALKQKETSNDLLNAALPPEVKATPDKFEENKFCSSSGSKNLNTYSVSFETDDKCANISSLNVFSVPDLVALAGEPAQALDIKDNVINSTGNIIEKYVNEKDYNKLIDEQCSVIDLKNSGTAFYSDQVLVSPQTVTEFVSENFSFVAAEASRVAQDIFDALENLESVDAELLKMSSTSDISSLENDLKMKTNETTGSVNNELYCENSFKQSGQVQNLQFSLEKADDKLGTMPETKNNTYSRICDSDPSTESSEGKDDKNALHFQIENESKDAISHDLSSIKGNIKSGHEFRKEPGIAAYSQPEIHLALQEESISSKSTTDQNDSSRRSQEEIQVPFRNQALDFLEKLISQSTISKSTILSSSSVDIQNLGNKASQIESCSENLPSKLIQGDLSLMQDQLIQLRDAIYEQDTLHKEEVMKYQSRMKSVEEREQLLSQRMIENSQGQQQMSLILEEYEKTISRLVAEKEHERQTFVAEKENLIKEKDIISGHLSNIEIAFSDVHQKYEKSKQVIQGFKNNEEALRATVNEYEAALKKQEQKYEILKSHAMNQLESANQELVAMRRSHEAENSKLKAMLKKAEIKIHSLEETLQQKVKENQELVNICDELIGKVGSSD